jgi:hypothetical protein
VTPPRAGRTQACSDDQARTRLAHARKFLEFAELAGEDDPEYSGVAAALAVLAGIAAADAACCKALGRRSRGQDHHLAEDLVRDIEPGGTAAANNLRRLLDRKDQAHYGLYNVSGADLQSILRQSRALVDFGSAVLLR